MPHRQLKTKQISSQEVGVQGKDREGCPADFYPGDGAKCITGLNPTVRAAMNLDRTKGQIQADFLDNLY